MQDELLPDPLHLILSSMGELNQQPLGHMSLISCNYPIAVFHMSRTNSLCICRVGSATGKWTLNPSGESALLYILNTTGPHIQLSEVL